MNPFSIAIVGMASRFPGARSTAEFWQNLRNGVESIRDLTEAELLAAGASRDDLANPDYVRRAAILDNVPLFDASFFGFSPRDASIMDPQHRHFLECAWEALEDAAHPPQNFPGSIGVFCGSGMNTYLIHNLLANRHLLESAGLFQLKQTGNDKDVLATRVSYQFDLRGPSINVQTACSTSLVAVHLACQSLLNFECDMALAGGVTIEIPHGLGYEYREGEILSRDGHCRSFDAESSGTVFSSGLGIVVLRRLEDALQDRDSIRAVILGSAINNDGARKVGYLAPSVEGQAEVIAEALGYADVPACSISYVETHGTGTRVGDPIEIRALTKAFQGSTARTAVGSLKSNIGHLDAAAGVAGLIKTVLSLEHEQIPASLHFEKINPHIELEGSPFYVNSKLTDWPRTSAPRRAGVTALGIGGTNAHVVLEEAPQPKLARQFRPYQILTVSAKTPSAADQAFANLASHLASDPETNLADAAFTCQLGRAAFAHRRALVVEDTPASLACVEKRKIISGAAARVAPVFLFSGQGSQYVNMGRELYEREPVFRDTLDLCAGHLREPLGIDLIAAIYPPDAEKEAASEKLNQTWLTQPALFAVEYALAQWWISLGVEPAAMAGHSIGEYVAACIAGVFSLEDALSIVAARGRLIYDLPAGAMLAVPLAADELNLPADLSLAAINNPSLCAVSGPEAAIAAYEERLKNIGCRRLFTSHAFHSAMMDPILGVFEQRLRGIAFHAPRIPYLSNVTGTWIKPEEATDASYWARHIRSTVRFSDNLTELFRSPDRVLIEAGPGNVLTALARQQGGASARAFASLPHPRENVPALRCALETVARVWTLGANIDWTRLHAPNSAQRIPLPTYPFERQKFWIEPDKIAAQQLPISESIATSASTSISASVAESNAASVSTPTALVGVPEPLQKLGSDAPAPAPVKAIESPAASAGEESIENTLTVWWQELLGVQQIHLDDNFFELGGHSLVAVRLIAKIKKTYRVDLELADLFEAPSVHRFSALIEKTRQQSSAAQKSRSTPSPIPVDRSMQDLPMMPGVEGHVRQISKIPDQHRDHLIVPAESGNPSRPPFFMIHAYHLYPLLPQRLGGDQPFYGVQEYEPGEWVGDWKLEGMMARYVQAIRTVQPHGPYFIGGFCSSGIPAFEVARQLEEANETVLRLILIDPVDKQPFSTKADAKPGENRLQRPFQIKDIDLPPDAGIVTYLKALAAEKSQHVSARATRWLYSRLVRLYMRWGLQIPVFLGRKLVDGIRVVTLEATRNYTLKQFHGNIDVFLSDEFQSHGNQDGLSPWALHTTGIATFTRMHGNHISAFRPPHIDEFARLLRSTLDAAIAEYRDAQPAAEADEPGTQEKLLGSEIMSGDGGGAI